MSKVVSSLSALLPLFLCISPEAMSAETRHTFANGVEVRVLQGADEHRMAVRLDTKVGLGHESAFTGGSAAAYLAALLNSRTESYAPSEWVQQVLESGLTLTPHLERDSSGFMLAGGIHLLERALWLVGDRLTSLDVKEADVRQIRPAIFRGAESDKYHAVTARGDEQDTLKHLLFGTEG